MQVSVVEPELTSVASFKILFSEIFNLYVVLESPEIAAPVKLSEL